MREVTERPEAVDAGTVRLVGADRKKIVAAASELLSNELSYKAMSQAHNPYGDGKACERIISVLKKAETGPCFG
jgi:UDP-N-acetylglucosamine 2-epimerase (non-hydrolysing)